MPPTPPDDDPLRASRFVVLTELARVEAALFRRVWSLLKEWGAKVRDAVFGHRTVGGASIGPDPLGVFTASPWFGDHLDPIVVEIEEIWTDGYAGTHEAPEAIPDGQWGSRQAIAKARNRLVRVPDSVFKQVNGMTLKATTGRGKSDAA